VTFALALPQQQVRERLRVLRPAPLEFRRGTARGCPWTKSAPKTEALAGKLCHKRLIVVYGEHPESDVEYIAASIRAVYSVKVQARKGVGQIRRVNVNAAPMRVDELKILHQCGLGTFQVFQETYDRRAYARLHPAGTIKSDFRWRLTAMHRAQEAGIDDNGIGALYGLADWRVELLGQQAHALEMERFCGIGRTRCRSRASSPR
jgi:2-iminoacetate synthase